MNYLESVSWEKIESLNQELCNAGKFQVGRTSDGYDGAKLFFESLKNQIDLSLPNLIDGFKELHRRAPFLYLNGNTFNVVAMEVLRDYHVSKELKSTICHHIAGVKIMSDEELATALTTVTPIYSSISPYWDVLLELIKTNTSTDQILENISTFMDEQRMSPSEKANFRLLIDELNQGKIDADFVKPFFEPR